MIDGLLKMASSLGGTGYDQWYQLRPRKDRELIARGYPSRSRGWFFPNPRRASPSLHLRLSRLPSDMPAVREGQAYSSAKSHTRR